MRPLVAGLLPLIAIIVVIAAVTTLAEDRLEELPIGEKRPCLELNSTVTWRAFRVCDGAVVYVWPSHFLGIDVYVDGELMNSSSGDLVIVEVPGGSCSIVNVTRYSGAGYFSIEALPPGQNSTLVSPDYDCILGERPAVACEWWDFACRITVWLQDQLYESAQRVGHVVSPPVIRLSIAIPIFNISVPPELEGMYVETSLKGPMQELYVASRLAGFGILGASLVLSAIWVLGESLDVVKQGEGMATLKRVILSAALIFLADRIYDVFALGMAYVNYIILPKEVAEVFFGGLFLIWLALTAFLPFGGGFMVLIASILIAIAMLILSGLRLLLTAALASLLPVAIALSNVPFRAVREIGMNMMTILTGLVVVTTVTAAIFRLGASIAGATPIRLDDPAGTLLKLVMIMASLAAPALALVIVPRASIIMFATAAFYGYILTPIRHAGRITVRTTKRLVTTATGAAGGGAGVAVAGASSRVIEED